MMLLPRAVKVYVATAPCNLRRSFDGLSNEVREVLAKDALSGHVFVFLNRRKTQVKLLLWDVTIAKLHLLEAVRNKRRSSCPFIRSEAFAFRWCGSCGEACIRLG